MEVHFIDDIDKMVDILFKIVDDSEIRGGTFKKPIKEIKLEMRNELLKFFEN